MTKPLRATSYDVARLAGVSQSAVSRCFKPGASISERMRERVLAAARELNYQPNAMARGLITKRSGLVAVLVASTMNFYYPEVLFQLTQRFSENGMRVLLFTVDSEADADDILNPIWQYSVDGVISASHLSVAQYESLRERDIPVVMFNRSFAGLKTHSIWADSAAAVEEMIDDLAAMGHQRFALLRGPEVSMVGRSRAEHVTQAIASRGLELVAEARGDYHYASGANQTATLLEASPTAIIAANDMMAMGVMDALRHTHGLDVPGDISVAGFDGTAYGQFAAYGLTTIRQPIGRMADAAVDLLLEIVERSDLSSERRVFESEYMPSKSTSPRKAS